MIPKQLHIKNFLSYGPEPQTIDFLSYNLICLSGKNGHGKSALLDAMTWALWGQARKTSGTTKADEGLVHLGQKHMLVIFDFEINDIHYRVRREFVKTQSHPFSALDFGIVKADQTFTTLTDKTIKATQAKLEKTIGITYESFINSAFLRQGQANEFSKKSAKERKEILATILQLDRFEDLKKIALEKSKILQQNLLQKQSICDRIGQEINELQTIEQEKDLCLTQLATIDEQEQQLATLMATQEKKKEQLQELHKKYEFLQLQQSQECKQITLIQEQIETLTKIYEQVASQQKDAGDIELRKEEQKKMRGIVAAHQEKLSKRLELKDQYLTLQEKKQAIEKELSQEKSELSQKYEIAQKIITEQRDQQTVIIQKHRGQLKNIVDQLSKLAQELTHTAGQHCPMCEQNLSDTHKLIVHEKLTVLKTQEEAQIAAAQKKIIELTDLLAKNKIDQEKLPTLVINKEKELALHTLIEKIDVLKQTGIALAYNKEQHDVDAKKLEELESFLIVMQNLDKEIAQQDQRKKQIDDLQKQLNDMLLSSKNFDAQLDLIKNCPIELAEQIQLQQQQKIQAQEIALIKIDLLNKKSVFELQHKKMICLRKELVDMEKYVQTITIEINDFAEIVKALGKDGLQALLIEQALPEIEQEANILLAQLTDNQTQIYIESLRDLKKGGSKETLDIKISDSIGLRPYEMFSGGEAFRIDFALRIAISKLLARRAGTALQTLIIDEGFGSQDDDGLQLIMDSILKIQDNFAKVIIVSHLPAMKEQFPVQFLVEKKSSGSVITVIEQG